MKQVYIVASSFNSARDFAIRNIGEISIPRNWRYVGDGDCLRGVMDIVVYLVPGWTNHPYMNNIQHSLSYLVLHQRAKIIDVENLS